MKEVHHPFIKPEESDCPQTGEDFITSSENLGSDYPNGGVHRPFINQGSDCPLGGVRKSKITHDL